MALFYTEEIPFGKDLVIKQLGCPVSMFLQFSS